MRWCFRATWSADQGLAVGDAVVLQAGDNVRRMQVVGIVVDNTIFLGGELAGKAFLSRADLARLQGQRAGYRFVALGLDSREPERVDEILARVEAAHRDVGLVTQPAYDEIEAARQASRLLSLAPGGDADRGGGDGRFGRAQHLDAERDRAPPRESPCCGRWARPMRGCWPSM